MTYLNFYPNLIIGQIAEKKKYAGESIEVLPKTPEKSANVIASFIEKHPKHIKLICKSINDILVNPNKYATTTALSLNLTENNEDFKKPVKIEGGSPQYPLSNIVVIDLSNKTESCDLTSSYAAKWLADIIKKYPKALRYICFTTANAKTNIVEFNRQVLESQK